MKKVLALSILLLAIPSLFAAEPTTGMQWTSSITTASVFVGDYDVAGGAAYVYPAPITSTNYFILPLGTQEGKMMCATIQSCVLAKRPFTLYYNTANRYVYRVNF